MQFEVDTIENHQNIDHNQSGVAIINEKISYNEFFQNYMYLNIPCILKNVTQDWEAHAKWLTKEGKPNLDYLNNKYGNCEVAVYDCNERYFNSQRTECCKLGYFLNNHWNNLEKLKYLKDWHLKSQIKEDNFYQVPIYFASDWLNEFLIENSDDDYRFVYIGRSGTWTPFHADVFNSYSWSANVCGVKRWILFPPGEEHSFRDNLNNLPYDIRDIYQTRKYFELIQNPGEAIFVPSGWYHQVWNLQDTISINHNWVNGCNLEQMWMSIRENLNKVKNEIEDCKDMEDFVGHCQVMLKASYGMDFYMFYEFIRFIASKRMKFLNSGRNNVLFHGHYLGENHAKFDLRAVQIVLEKFAVDDDVKELFLDKSENPQTFLNDITTSLGKNI